MRNVIVVMLPIIFSSSNKNNKIVTSQRCNKTGKKRVRGGGEREIKDRSGGTGKGEESETDKRQNTYGKENLNNKTNKRRAQHNSNKKMFTASASENEKIWRGDGGERSKI